jgi:hypothetical protein
MNWQPRINSAAKLSTTMKRAWTLIVPSCTVNVMLPFWRSRRPPAPTICNSGGPGYAVAFQILWEDLLSDQIGPCLCIQYRGDRP